MGDTVCVPIIYRRWSFISFLMFQNIVCFILLSHKLWVAFVAIVSRFAQERCAYYFVVFNSTTMIS